MRHLLLRFVVVAMVLGTNRYGSATTDTTEPQGTVVLDSMTVAQLEAAGDAARLRKDYEQAARYFEAALKKDRKNAGLYNKLGLAELKGSNLQPARAAFQRAVKRDSKFADAQNNLGAVDYMEHNYGAAAKQFKKAAALDETRAAFHVNLGAAWFAQKKLERAVAEYARALELDPEALISSSRTGVTAQISSPEERAKYRYMLAKIYAKRGEAERCLECLRMAKEDGYRDLANVYKDEEFTDLRQDPRLAQIIPAPASK